MRARTCELLAALSGPPGTAQVSYPWPPRSLPCCRVTSGSYEDTVSSVHNLRRAGFRRKHRAERSLEARQHHPRPIPHSPQGPTLAKWCHRLASKSPMAWPSPGKFQPHGEPAQARAWTRCRHSLGQLQMQGPQARDPGRNTAVTPGHRGPCSCSAGRVCMPPQAVQQEGSAVSHPQVTGRLVMSPAWSAGPEGPSRVRVPFRRPYSSNPGPSPPILTSF